MKFYINSVHIIKKFIRHFNEKSLRKIAFDTDFIKRERELKADTFFNAFVFGCTSLNHVTLENIIDYCKEIQPGINITKQGLSDKLADGARFMEYLYQNVLAEFITEIWEPSCNLSDEIHDVKIFDSTFVELLNKLRPYYKGYTGDASKSGLKLEILYSLRDRRVITNEVYAAVDSDTNFADSVISNVKEKELFIGDLGYYNVDMFKKIDKSRGWFLSKIKSNTALYIELDNGKLQKTSLEELTESSSGVIDTTLQVGFKKDKRIRCRFVGKKLSGEELDLVKSKAKKRKDSELSKWRFLITNADDSILAIDKIFTFYRLRWQIELLFKCWKSFVNIDKIKDKGIHYLHCMLYGNLIQIALEESLYNSLNKVYSTESNGELSILKFFNAITNKIKEISFDLFRNSASYSELNKILDRIYRRSIPEKRKRKRTREIILA